MARLFVAIFVPVDTQRELAAVVEKADISSMRWIGLDSLHITLKFLGEVAEDNVESIKTVLTDVCSKRTAMELHLRSGGVFPSARHANVFWTSVEGDRNALQELALEIDQRLADLGFPMEERSFSSHLTLARLKKEHARTKYRSAHREANDSLAEQFCTLFADFKSSSFHVTKIDLVQSRLSPHGSRYGVLHSFALRPS